MDGGGWGVGGIGSLFFKQEMELSLIGLQNAGKTSLVNVITVCLSVISPSLSVCLYVWMSVSLSVWLSF
jgi:hypothetical protein